MADEQQVEEVEKKSMMPLIGGAVAVLLICIGALFFLTKEDTVKKDIPPAEYVVKEQMFQLKDGSYLRLGFSIVVNSDKVESVRMILEKESPGRLPSSLNILLGNKSRKDLIDGSHKRESFARELKKILEERVFRDYNKRQESITDGIEVREILISQFVTQQG